MRRALALTVLALAALAVAWWWHDGAPETQRLEPMSATERTTPDQVSAGSQDQGAPTGQAALSPPPAPSAAEPATTPEPRFSSREEMLEAMAAAPIPEAELEDIGALRALARTGDGDAAWKMLKHVRACADVEFLDDAQVLARERALASDRPAPADEIGRAFAEVGQYQREQSALKSMREHRHHCPQLRPDDDERMLEWLELTLASGYEEFLYRLSIPSGLPLPRDLAWRVRHAERLADLIVRAREAYLARMAAGDRRLLARARFFYGNEHLWEEIDPYQVYLYSVVDAGLSGRLPIDDSHWYTSRDLDPDQRQRATAEAAQVLQRCCGIDLPSP